MLELDGSQGEGGGQTVRTALSLSVITGTPFHITEVRAGRPEPGLKPQHLAGVQLMQRLSSAEVKGASIGSRELTFRPGTLTGGRVEFDVGTAGSLTLLVQTVLPALVTSSKPTELVLTGGTDVRWSPPVDHYRMVLLPLLRRMGAHVELEVVRRGFYPKGGGLVRLRVEGGPLSPMRLEERGGLVRVRGRACVQNLPEKVADRMLASAAAEVPGMTREREVAVGPSPGAVLTLAAEYEGTVLGASALGERGVPAERVGREAAACLRSMRARPISWCRSWPWRTAPHASPWGGSAGTWPPRWACSPSSCLWPSTWRGGRRTGWNSPVHDGTLLGQLLALPRLLLDLLEGLLDEAGLLQ
jgi:RNA 3'-phosphate cyclase